MTDKFDEVTYYGTQPSCCLPDGTPCSMRDYLEAVEAGAKLVASSFVTEDGYLVNEEQFDGLTDQQQKNLNAIHISTVWLGINHNHGSGRPVIFETMVFGPDELQWRYHTIEQARAGHELVCWWVLNRISDDELARRMTHILATT